ncbi:MAG: hypothetical protein ACXVLQ_15255, partial [Bacteriovorax sp.]
MKRNKAKRAQLALLLLANALFFTSCSSLWLHRGQTVDSVQQGESNAKVTMVPKEQYDELARKYQELLNQSKQLAKIEVPSAPEAPKKEEAQTKPEVGGATSIDPSELVNHIDKAIPDAATVDAVDALKPNGPSEKVV